MSNPAPSDAEAASESTQGFGWNQFWFSGGSVIAAARIRALLCLAAALYFISATTDVATWLTGSTPFSVDNMASFFHTANLQSEARWIISPLFLLDSMSGGSGLVYYLYLIVAIVLCVIVAIGRGGPIAPWLLWGMFAGWANRLMLLSGIAEPLLSVGLFAAAIAPPASGLAGAGSNPVDRDWRAGFSLRFMAVQVSVFAVATVATMLGGRVWWNGYGAYALLAPVQDRTFAFGGEGSIFSAAIVYDSLTHLMIVALPLGILLAWLRPKSWLGPIMIGAWCLTVAVLGSHLLYGLTFACMALSIRQARR